MRIIKASGKRERFNPRKVRGSLLRTGVSKKTADEIIFEVKGRIHEDMTTRQVFKIVMKVLNEKQSEIASCYDLKGAIMRLGPAGFNFETFVGEILEEYGYYTKLRTKVKGNCAAHEIDILAEERDSGSRHIIECKYHNSLGTYIDLKEVLYTHARFLDLNNGVENFDSVWMACNTRASSQAIKYANCVGMKLLCWRYPKGQGLETLIEKKNLYPITMLRSLDNNSLERFSKAGYMLTKDLTQNNFQRIREKTRLKKNKLQKIREEAKSFCCGS